MMQSSKEPTKFYLVLFRICYPGDPVGPHRPKPKFAPGYIHSLNLIIQILSAKLENINLDYNITKNQNDSINKKNRNI